MRIVADLRLPSSAEVRRFKGQCAGTVLSFRGEEIPCTRAAGYGPDGRYCKQHAQKLENPEPPKPEKVKQPEKMLARRWIVSRKVVDDTNEVLLPDGAVPVQLMFNLDGKEVVVFMVPKDLEFVNLKAKGLGAK